jgi:hypothetical protein
VAGPTCRWPTTAHGRVSQPACDHARAATLRWLNHHTPSCIGGVSRSPTTSTPRAAHAATASTCLPHPYPCVPTTLRPRSPPHTRSSHQSLTPLCSPRRLPLALLCPLLTAPATTIAIVHEHWSSAITPCHRSHVKPPACATVRPAALAASSSAWSSPCTAASVPFPVKQPTP